jgi:hypothetical protein
MSQYNLEAIGSVMPKEIAKCEMWKFSQNCRFGVFNNIFICMQNLEAIGQVTSEEIVKCISAIMCQFT